MQAPCFNGQKQTEGSSVFFYVSHGNHNKWSQLFHTLTLAKNKTFSLNQNLNLTCSNYGAFIMCGKNVICIQQYIGQTQTANKFSMQWLERALKYMLETK